MERHVENGVEYFLSVDQSLMRSLYILRSWPHLRMAVDHDRIWMRGFSEIEIESVRVLSLPSASRYYLIDSKLYLVASRLPSLEEPDFNWIPIQKGLTVDLPKQNFNYFGMNHRHSISLIPTTEEQTVNVLICSTEILYSYVSTAPKVRLQSMKWTLYGAHSAIVIGTPILPIQSEDYWTSACFILPAGYKIKYENMINLYESTLLELSLIHI